MAEAPRPAPIPGKLVEYLLLGPAEDQRQLQDSPILGDVWLAYAADPASLQDLLITPHRQATAADVAAGISAALPEVRRGERADAPAGIAYLQGIVAARLYFDEVLRIVVPMTLWWQARKVPEKLRRDKEYKPAAVKKRVGRLLDRGALAGAGTPSPGGDDRFSPLDRYLALAGLLLWAGTPGAGFPRSTAPPTAEEVLTAAGAALGDIVTGLLDHLKQPAGERAAPEPPRIFQVSLNRRAMPALDRSVPAVKADAARTLFRVSCSKIAWAVLDSGIDSSHDAFKTADGKTRVRKTLDFTRVRDLVSSDNDRLGDARLDGLLRGVEMPRAEARKRLAQLAEDARGRRPVNWDVVEELITLTDPPTPRSPHGTHVAGIIGADRHGNGTDSGYEGGLCPDIRLYDFRVLARSLEDTEFAVIAALQYIRYVNEQHSYITIHGANLSLSIPHNVRNYACGRTPVCNECERLVESGVVVVAAAGNRGYQNFETKDGVYEGYAAFSITDPGNADGVITVGATHGNWPHTYGVSFFSSRGPTGDGRLKPDLVAPGERIQSTIPGNEWAAESGTSMAAPHVSGAAAMLLARYAEMVGQPRRVKRVLCEAATDLARERSFQGRGMLDVLRAFQSI
jgi:hypothetical protein